MKHLSYLAAIILLVACNGKPALSEHEVICKISGKGFDAKNIRIHLAWTDFRFDDNYQEIDVKDGCFEADVVLDTNQVYEICIPDFPGEWSSYKTAHFFFHKDGVEFGMETFADDKRIIVENPKGNNNTYYSYKSLRDKIYMDWYTRLMASQDSLFNNKLMYNHTWEKMWDAQRDKKLSQEVKDSLRNEANKLAMSGDHRTPAGRAWHREWVAYRTEKQNSDYRHLQQFQPDKTSLYMIMDNIRISQSNSTDISKWLNLYEEKYKNLFPNDRMHNLISETANATAMIEGRHFIDFTLPDRSGNSQTLSELIKGKVAVLELWASWCSSCRANAKSLIPLYKKYHNNGFTVVGIAREYKETGSWKNAIQTDTYPWPNLVAMEEHHSLWAQYGIPNAAGRTLLINADGIVVKINPSAKEVEEYMMAQQNK